MRGKSLIAVTVWEILNRLASYIVSSEKIWRLNFSNKLKSNSTILIVVNNWDLKGLACERAGG